MDLQKLKIIEENTARLDIASKDLAFHDRENAGSILRKAQVVMGLSQPYGFQPRAGAGQIDGAVFVRVQAVRTLLERVQARALKRLNAAA
jgi:hypothetical protein